MDKISLPYKDVESVLGTLYPREKDGILVLRDNNIPSEISISNIAMDIKDPYIIRAVPYDMNTSSFTMDTMVIKSLSLYDDNNEVREEAISILSSLCKGGTVSFKEYNPSSFAMALAIVHTLGIPLFHTISHMMRENFVAYVGIHIYIGIPYFQSSAVFPPVYTIRGKKQAIGSISLFDSGSITLASLDGEFLCVRTNRKKVFHIDDMDYRAKILARTGHVIKYTLSNTRLKKESFKHEKMWTMDEYLNRKENIPYVVDMMVSLGFDISTIYQVSTDPIKILTPYSVTYLSDLINENNIYLLSPDVQVVIYGSIPGYQDSKFACSIIDRDIHKTLLVINIAIDRYKSSKDDYDTFATLCRHVFKKYQENSTLVTSIVNILEVKPYFYEEIIPKVEDIDHYIISGLSLSWYIHLCTSDNIEILKEKYPNNIEYINMRLKSK